MLTYHLDHTAKMPLYEQLYRAIRADIMNGVLAGGTRLPAKRPLAEHLKVSQITVETAYGQLTAEGYASRFLPGQSCPVRCSPTTTAVCFWLLHRRAYPHCASRFGNICTPFAASR